MVRNGSNRPTGFVFYQNFLARTTVWQAKTYDSMMVTVGSLDFIVDREFISEAIGFPQIGELWFKGKTVLPMDFNIFLKEEQAGPNWKMGF